MKDINLIINEKYIIKEATTYYRSDSHNPTYIYTDNCDNLVPIKILSIEWVDDIFLRVFFNFSEEFDDYGEYIKPSEAIEGEEEITEPPDIPSEKFLFFYDDSIITIPQLIDRIIMRDDIESYFEKSIFKVSDIDRIVTSQQGGVDLMQVQAWYAEIAEKNKEVKRLEKKIAQFYEDYTTYLVDNKIYTQKALEFLQSDMGEKKLVSNPTPKPTNGRYGVKHKKGTQPNDREEPNNKALNKVFGFFRGVVNWFA